MKAIIAEKPSVAREIASLLNAQENKDGYLQGNGYCITWAVGHLVSLGMPEDHGIRGFEKTSLPIFPHPFILKPRTIKKEHQKGYHHDSSALRQLKIIQNVFNQCDSIIVATDAGREGELIFRYIYDYLQCRKPFQRLWISSLTEKALQKGFEQLQPGSVFDGLYDAAKARSEADWLVGINATQALTIAGGDEVYSLGRVQTPTLAMICQRFQDHINFQIKKYWQIQLNHRKDYLDFTGLSSTQWENKKEAEQVLNSIERAGKATVDTVNVKTVQETAPLLFDLTGLQKEANRKLGLSADEVLQTAQSLYEKKFITYPRTGSSYIPEDVWTEIPDLVRTLNEIDRFRSAVSVLKFGNFNKRMVNDLKVTDHHGLLITTKIPSALTATEKAIYDMIAYRLLEALSEHCTKEVSHITVKVHHYEFNIRGSKLINKGWRAIQGILSETKENDQHQDQHHNNSTSNNINSLSPTVEEILMDLPQLKTGDELKISRAELQERQTRPPKLYNEADLLSAMENAGRLTEIKEQKDILANIGIGTPATRASIIETLLSRNYIIRKKRSLVPTDKGLKVYSFVKDQKIANVRMTAEWEITLDKIEKGEFKAGQFITAIKQYTTEITQELLALPVNKEVIPELKCPKCQQQNLTIREKMIKCPDESCNWFQYRIICGVQLSLSEITALIKNRRTPLIKNMKAKNGKKFEAYLLLKDDHTTAFDFS